MGLLFKLPLLSKDFIFYFLCTGLSSDNLLFISNCPVFDIRTPLGRGRAWLRLALMQKKLSDYMKTIINRKDLLRCVCIKLC